jgi:hypothetical protein
MSSASTRALVVQHRTATCRPLPTAACNAIRQEPALKSLTRAQMQPRAT